MASPLPAAEASQPPIMKIPSEVPPRSREDITRDLFDFLLQEDGNIKLCVYDSNVNSEDFPLEAASGWEAYSEGDLEFTILDKKKNESFIFRLNAEEDQEKKAIDQFKVAIAKGTELEACWRVALAQMLVAGGEFLWTPST